jgi:serine/threonine protein kinase
MIETEVKILQMMKHDNIVQLFQIYEYSDKIFLVMELYTTINCRVSGGELFDEIMKRGTFQEKDAAMIVHKILNSISYMHGMGIVHRDLKVYIWFYVA